MPDLISRLSERLEEVERVARAATPGAWIADGRVVVDISHNQVSDAWKPLVITEHGTEGTCAHIALWDPEAVLRLVAAHRKVVKRYQDLYERRNDGPQNEQLVRHAKAIAVHMVIEMLAAGFGVTEEG